MKERMTALRPENKTKKTAADLAKEWEKKLAKEGLTAEPGEDKGAVALRELVVAEAGPQIPELEIRQRIQEYYVNRGGNITFGDHRLAAAAIAAEFGISADDIPEDLMKAVQDEVAELELKVNKIIQEYEKRESPFRFQYDKMNEIIMKRLSSEYEDFSPMAFQGIISRFLGE